MQSDWARLMTEEAMRQTNGTEGVLPDQEGPLKAAEQALVLRAFAARLLEDDLAELLSYVNGLTDHRFSGVYQFEPGWVVSIALYDRVNPQLRIGADVKMRESYCWLTGTCGTGYIIEDALNDARLHGHAAREDVRSYVAVLLHDRGGAPWGTLCHFDFAPRQAGPSTLTTLEAFRPLVEEMFVRDKPARWDPDAPSLRRRARRETLSGEIQL